MSSAPEHKRQRLRKGTTSCWECKRRKVKCEDYEGLGSTACRPCLRRGSHCVSQELPEEHSLSLNNAAEASGRDAYVTPEAEGTGSSTLSGAAIPATKASRHDVSASRKSRGQQYLHGTHRTLQDRHRDLSRLLRDALPSQEDTEVLCTASLHPSVIGHEFLTMPYDKMSSDRLATSGSLKDVPAPDTHPVLIARYMLLLAMVLQHLHGRSLKDFARLSEPPKAIMERLVHRTTTLVTTDDALLGSIEGLQCVMIEATFQANGGSLRRSWVSTRRAIAIAQLMGLHRSNDRAQYAVLDRETEYHPQHMWFRLVSQERYLCLMLGLPQGSPDRSMSSEKLLAQDTPTGRLERLHCVIASRILERNEAHSSSPDIELTSVIDQELQAAARTLPSKWWLVPNLEAHSKDPHAMFWETRRLFSQVLHYNLLNQLHLPYMLFSHSGRQKYDYSQVTCVTASREVLSRFITLSRFNEIACSCRSIDFLALMAAMTLLLAHLDSVFSQSKLLTHQYLSDRAMIEQVQENMEEIDRQDPDALSAQSAQLLRQLLNIDLDPTNHHRQAYARRVSVQDPGSETEPVAPNDAAVVSVHIPYFGTIRIARDGITKESARPQSDSAPDEVLSPPQAGNDATRMSTTASLPGRPQTGVPTLPTPSASSDAGAAASIDTEYRPLDANEHTLLPSFSEGARSFSAGPMPDLNAGPEQVPTSFVTLNQHDAGGILWPNDDYPSLAAGTEDWAFQGVDMAFFDSLIGGGRG